MPHLGLTRPLGKFYLTDKLGNKPRGRILVLYFLIEGPLVAAQRLHGFIKGLQRRLIEARADMTRQRRIA
jgi:hypothetical protein